jgi:hypothetical protein
MKKVYIIIGIIVVALLLVLFILTRNKSEYLIIDNTTFLEYKDDTFKEVEYDDLLDRTYSCFSGGVFIGYYDVYARDTNNELFMTNNANDKAYTFEHPYLFVTSNVEVLDFKVKDANDSDLSYLTYDLKKEFIESIDDLDSFKKVTYDIDDDGVNEYIYSASYYGIDDNNSFSIVFLVKNNKIYLMGESNTFDAYDEEGSFGSLDNFTLKYLLKIDDSIKMVVGMESTDITYYQIYSFDKELKEEYGG